MYKLSLAIVFSVMASLASLAHAEIIKVASPYSVEESLDRLQEAVTGAGATIFARVEHAEGAAMVGKELAPMALLIVGNPKVGTLALEANPLAGLALPVRILAYEDAEGNVWLAYENPADMLARFDIPADAPVVVRITKGLGAMTGMAVAE